MDIVYIQELKIKTVIGIYAWERSVRQTVSIDLEMGADVSKAALHDDISNALDYKAVAKRISSFVEASEFKLVETLAERVAEIVRSEFGVQWLSLRVSKPGAVRYSKDVGVVIERGQRW